MQEVVEYSDWTHKCLGDVCRPVGGGTPSRSQPKYWNGEIPWASVKDFTDDSIILSETQEHITQAGLDSSASTQVSKDTPVICTRMAVGRCALTAQPTAINQDLKALLLIEDFDLKFFIRLLRFHASFLDHLSVGTTVRGISAADLLALPLAYGPKPEQSRIAAVLDSVDGAISKTEAVIAKLRQVRAGLLYDLLTRGLDANGQLRDPVAHPEQFQDSPLGRIPRDWSAAPLRHFLASAEYGISSSLSNEGNLPVLRMNNIAGGEAALDDLKFATCDVPTQLLLRTGDVLFNRTNSYEHVGRTGIWRGQLRVATFASYLVRLNPLTKWLTSEFLNLVLNMPESQQRMRRYATPAVQQVNINPTSLQLMFVAVPRLVTEQNRIAEVASECARPLMSQTVELVKLISLKTGLMADLLTGRVRVPEDGRSSANRWTHNLT